MSVAPDDTTIAVCKCGNIVLAAVTKHIDAKWKRYLMDAVMDGCSVQHVDSKTVRTMEFECKCAAPPSEERLV